MWLANFVGGFLLLFIGLIVRFFKAGGLIAGYNTMSKEEKEKYNEEALTNFVGNMLLTAASILIVGGAISFFTDIPDYLAGISWVLFVLILVGGVIYMNTGNRFKKQL